MAPVALSIRILTLGLLFLSVSASPVNLPSAPGGQHVQEQDRELSPDLIPAGPGDASTGSRHSGLDGRAPSATSDDGPAVDHDVLEDVVDDDVDDVEDDVGMEEEMFRKLEGRAIPKKVVKALKEISDHKEVLNGKGNTVRSYIPVKEEKCAGLGEAYVFTMRPLKTRQDPEDLKYAELYFHVKNAQEVTEVSVSFYVVSGTECHPIGLQRLDIQKNGWLTTNVTSLFSHTLVDSTARVTVAMFFREGGAIAEYEWLRATPPDAVSMKFSKPFMFVYTEDMSARTGDAQSNWQRLADQLASHDSESEATNSGRRLRRSVDVLRNDSNESISNEYSLVPVDSRHAVATHTTFPLFAEQNMKRLKASRRRARNNKKNRNSKNMMLDADDVTRTNKKKLNKPRPKHLDLERPSDPAVGTCTRHPMNVDFRDIGWDDYVIAPVTFSAYYCDGQCSFPIAKELHPSNHAIIQSIMNVLGVVPTPCCVPEKMDSMTILYIDEESTVSLKLFSNMRVISCGCH